MDNNHIYSKMLPVIAGAIFFMVLIFSFMASPETAVDASIYVTAITSSAGIWGSSIIWYNKKRSRETAYNLKIELYKQSSEQRLWFNREMAKIMVKYHLTENDLAKIDENGEADEQMQSAIESVTELTDSIQSEGDEPDTIETF